MSADERDAASVSSRPSGTSRISVSAALQGEMAISDIRLTPEVLRAQASIAREHRNPQMAASLERAAEMCALPDEDIMALYEALRPHRSTAAELDAWVTRLRTANAPACAAYVLDARSAYERRDLLRTAADPHATDFL